MASLTREWFSVVASNAQLKDATAESRATALRTLQHWQRDPDLAGVRDAEALAKLPETERDEWGSLWLDVVRLMSDSQTAEGQ